MPQKENWKTIPFHQNYMVSDLGNIKRIAPPWKGKIIKPEISPYGYKQIRDSKTGKWYSVHKCVTRTFLGEMEDGYVVDHKDRDKLNNRLDNLRYITHRKNLLNVDRANLNMAGARLHKDVKRNKPWFSQIQIKGKAIYLGSFKTELEASQAYQNAIPS